MNLYHTKWADDVSRQVPWDVYPRPKLRRSSFLNLNGKWNYAITSSDRFPEKYDGEILVPFSPESALSGVCRTVYPTEYLWYQRILTLSSPKPGKRIFLHFGAADQSCKVYVNGKKAGSHTGGYLPFSFDITDLLKDGTNEFCVCVRDLSDTSWHSRGKQKLKPGGMFYTAQSGIWQTVWMEEVPENYISTLRFFPDFDASRVKVLAETPVKTEITLTVFLPSPADDEMQNTLTVCGKSNEPFFFDLPDFRSWSPEDPYLYQTEITAGPDHVKSYFAMRKCDIQTDRKGIRRVFLNNRPYFQAGVLDQGYWPEGLYTAPCDEALQFDIRSAKALGFNMIRKHCKVEMERFYYHCDRIGMLVWQDMVNGGSSYRHWFVTYLATVFHRFGISIKDGKRSRRLLSRTDTDGQKSYYRELKEMISHLSFYPSIVTWVPFNEGWGQFDASKAAALIRSLDPDRLIDEASGWYDQGGGDFKSLHYYFFKFRYRREPVRALALTEFAGYSLPVKGHTCCDKVYGYKKFHTKEELTEAYKNLIRSVILPSVKEGVSVSVFTQMSDIEEEINGLFTYDRKVLKFDRQTMLLLNQKLRAAVNPEAEKETSENPHPSPLP